MIKIKDVWKSDCLVVVVVVEGGEELCPLIDRSGTYSICPFYLCVSLKKTLTLAVTFEWQVIEFSYFTCAFLVVCGKTVFFFFGGGGFKNSRPNMKVTFLKKKKKGSYWGH